jgi:hypothetical protein
MTNCSPLSDPVPRMNYGAVLHITYYITQRSSLHYCSGPRHGSGSVDSHSLGPSTHRPRPPPPPRLPFKPCLACLPCLRKPLMNFLSATTNLPIANCQLPTRSRSNSSTRNGHPSPFNLDTESQSSPENSTTFRAESVPLPKHRH